MSKAHGQFAITPARALDDTRFDGRENHLRALMVLGTYADRDGWCYPKLRTVADRLSIAKSTMSMVMSDLSKWGYLLIVHQVNDETGAQMQNKYRILFDGELPAEFDKSLQTPVQQSSVNAEPPVREAYGAAESPIREDGTAPEPPVQNPHGESNIERPIITSQLNVPESEGESPSSPKIEIRKLTLPAGVMVGFPENYRPVPKPARHSKSDAPPAIKVYRSVRRAFPRRETWDMICEKIGTDEDSLDLWKRVLIGWAAMGWNTQNVDGPLDYFERGEIPHGKNGKPKPKEQNPVADEAEVMARLAAKKRETENAMPQMP